MKVFLLKDLCEDSIDAVIISTNENVTVEQIQNAIDKTKEEKYHDWQWEDIVNCLPHGCEIYDKWSDIDIITY